MTDTVAQQTPRRGRGYRRTAVVVVVVVVVIGAVVVSAIGLGGRSDRPGSGPVASTATAAKVERRTLVQSSSIDGKIDFGTPEPLLVKATGTITWLPKVGATVRRGQTLVRIDDRPVVLLYGSLPQYRALAAPRPPADANQPESTPNNRIAPEPAASKPAVEPKGAAPTPAAPTPAAPTPAAPAKAAVAPFTGSDVEQFERNLVALGFGGFTVDRNFTASTTAAVKRWQKSLHVPPNGTVGIGDIVYADGPVRIAKVGARVGAPMSEDALLVSGKVRFVTADASTADLAWAKEGTKVSIELPDGTKTPGTVASVGGGGAPTAGGGDAAGGTVPVKVTAGQQKALTGQDGGPATVTYVAEKKENVLCVPVPALVALAEGGYGLEPAEPGKGGFVAVQTGMFADGLVEVSGPALSEGMTVRVPQ